MAVVADTEADLQIRTSVQAGASAWRKVESVLGDKNIFRKLKGKVLSSCVTPAYLIGLETMAMTDKQKEKLQVCENNWVRRLAEVKIIDKRRMEELMEEVGVEVSGGSW